MRPLSARFEQRLLGVAANFGYDLPLSSPKIPKPLSFRRAVEEVLSDDERCFASIGRNSGKPFPSLFAEILCGRVFAAFARPRQLILFAVAVGGALDFWHGVDAFFVRPGLGPQRETKYRVVTIDLSLRFKTQEELKADFLIRPHRAKGEPLVAIARAIVEELRQWKNVV